MMVSITMVMTTSPLISNLLSEKQKTVPTSGKYISCNSIIAGIFQEHCTTVICSDCSYEFFCFVFFIRVHLVIFYFSLNVNKSHEKTKSSNELILLTSTVSVSKD